MGIRCADYVTPLYPQKLALTSPTGGGRSVGIVRSRTKATEFSLVYLPQNPETVNHPMFSVRLCLYNILFYAADSDVERPSCLCANEAAPCLNTVFYCKRLPLTLTRTASTDSMADARWTGRCERKQTQRKLSSNLPRRTEGSYGRHPKLQP